MKIICKVYILTMIKYKLLFSFSKVKFPNKDPFPRVKINRPSRFNFPLPLLHQNTKCTQKQATIIFI